MRSRNIKPGFFKNDDLAETGLAGRLLFAGLWCLADREGRLADKPKRIKAEIFPYDDLDIEPVLELLAKKDFIIRYQADGIDFIQITKFKEHQNPHKREAESTIPGPDNNKARPRPDQGPAKTGMSPADSLIPDSLIPDSLIPDSNPPDGGSSPAATPHQEIIEIYHDTLPEMARVKIWNDQRQKLLRTRWREARERQTLDWWREYFATVRASPFLMGQNDKNWTPDLEWLVKPGNMVKVLEGKYNKEAGKVVKIGGYTF